MKASLLLPPARVLPDGSYLAVIRDPAATRRRTVRSGQRRRRGSSLPPDTAPVPGITVRVIECAITAATDDGTARTEPYRLITTFAGLAPLPGPRTGRQVRLAVGDRDRLPRVQDLPARTGRILRSRTPGLARQENWAYLAIYQAIRVITTRAAAGTCLDPGRISFTTALHAIRRSLPAARDNMARALAQAGTEITTALVPERPGRVWVRAVTQPRGPYPSRDSTRRPVSQHATYTITITGPATPTPTTTEQPQHPSKPANQPP